MSSIPLVPGKGVRLCSPVRCVDDPDCMGVVVGDDPVLGAMLFITAAYLFLWRSRDSIALDLTDATGRGHAAMSLTQHQEDFRGWCRVQTGWTAGEIVWGAPGGKYADAYISALDDLDIHNDTRLPDGSRLVDALALAIVLGAS